MLLVCLLTGCGKGFQSRPITDVTDLDGRRVGVEIACDTDYFLTGRKDLKLVRYNENAAILLAFQYDKVDAIALDELMWKFVAASHGGLRAVSPAFAESGYVVYFAKEFETVRNEFNAFLKEYRASEDYEEFLGRLHGFDGKSYEGPELPLTGTGAVLRVAVDAACFPRSYAEADGGVKGFDLEALIRFANEKNYRLDFVVSTYDDMIYGLQGGLYDVSVGFLSDLRKQSDLSDYLLVSDSMYETPLYFIEKTQQDITLTDE